MEFLGKFLIFHDFINHVISMEWNWRLENTAVDLRFRFEIFSTLKILGRKVDSSSLFREWNKWKNTWINFSSQNFFIERKFFNTDVRGNNIYLARGFCVKNTFETFLMTHYRVEKIFDTQKNGQNLLKKQSQNQFGFSLHKALYILT